MPEGLKLIVDADVSKAEDSISSFVNSTSSSFDSLANPSAFKSLQSAFDDLQKSGVVSLASIEDALTQLKAAVKVSTDPADIEKFNQAISFLNDKQKQLKDIGIDKHFEKVHVTSLRANSAALTLSRTFGILPAESSHVAHSLESIIFAFENIRAESGSTGAAIKSLASSIGSSLGIGLAITGISLLIESFSSEKKANEDATKAAEEHRKEEEEFAKTMDKAASATLGEADKLQDLKKLLEDTSNRYNTLTASIVKQGIAHALFDEKNAVLQKLLSNAISDRLKLEKDLAENPVKEFDANTFNKPLPFEDQLNNLKKLQRVPDQATVKFLQTAEATQKLNHELKLVNDIAAALGISFDQFVDKPGKANKEFDLMGNLLDLLKKDALEIRKQFELMNQQEFKNLQKATANIKLDTISTEFAPEAERKASKSLQDRINNLTKNNPILIRANTKIELTTDQKNLISAIDNINKIIEGVINDSFANIGQLIGTALSGGDIGNVFKQFGQIIGSGVEAIGKQLIALGTAAQLAKLGLSTLFKNPAIEIAAGVALVAVGSALQNVLGKGVKGFAEGGLVTGPTLGLIGEGIGTSRSNPEVVTPLDKLKGLLSGVSGANIKVQFVGRIRGNDILLSNNRTNRQNARI